MSSLLVTPFQQHGDGAAARSWRNWEYGKYVASLDNTLYARFAYLVDVVASIVLLPLSLIGLVYGTLEAIFTHDVETASFLQFSTLLFLKKIDRLFASSLGALISPAGAYYFSERKVTPMVLGIVTTAALSYMLVNNHPGQFDWSLIVGN